MRKPLSSLELKKILETANERDLFLVGHMYIDKENIEAGMIDPYSILNIGAKYQYKNIDITLKLNNALDKLYSTYGYSYEWNGYQAYYWPGATRNAFVSFSYLF